MGDDDWAVIHNVCGVDPPSHNVWGDPRLNPVRSRLKRYYIKAQGFRCCYCQKRLATTHGRVWDVEHVIPTSKYPQFTFVLENLAACCVDCNSAKSNEDVTFDRPLGFPSESKEYRIIHPHYDNWGDHMLLGEVIYAPISEKGVETFRLCKLHRYYAMLGDLEDRILDRRYESEIESLLFAKDMREAGPSIAAIEQIIRSSAKYEPEVVGKPGGKHAS